MAQVRLTHTATDGRPLFAVASLEALGSVGAAERARLAELGIRSVSDLVAYRALQDARLLAAVADGHVAHAVDSAARLEDDTASTPPHQLRDLPITALSALDGPEAGVWSSSLGVRTIGELADYPPAREAETFLRSEAFDEPPSAPAELIPRSIGSVGSRVRFTSFVQDGFVDTPVNTRLVVDADQMSSLNPKLLALFQIDPRPRFLLGYDAEIVQEWVNMGTHLGEPVKSLGLAPGEMRHIAIVDWTRRVAAQRRETTDVSEQLQHEAVHQRALDEVTRATAAEHQHGGSSIEAGTLAVAAGGVVSAGIAGAAAVGLPAAGVGAAIGAVTGAPAAGVGALPGAGIGAVIGLVAGGAVGGIGAAAMAAGNLQFGHIESDTSGHREVMSNLAQRVNDITSQKSSSVRSLWSTVVVSQEEAEQENVQTMAIGNYNHAHALTIQYYEVLQHYRAQARIGRHQPLLFLPFKPVPFDPELVDAYWPVLRWGFEPDLRSRYDDVIARYDPTHPLMLTGDQGAEGLRLTRIKAAVQSVHSGFVRKVTLKTDTHTHSLDKAPNLTWWLAMDSDSEGPEIADVRSLTLEVQRPGPFGGQMSPVELTVELLVEVTDDSGRTFALPSRSLKGTTPLATGGEARIPLDLPEMVEAASNAPDVVQVLQQVDSITERINQRRYHFTRLLLMGIEAEQLADLVASLRLAPTGSTPNFPVAGRGPIASVDLPLSWLDDLPFSIFTSRGGLQLRDLVDTTPFAITGNTLVLRLRSALDEVDDKSGFVDALQQYLADLGGALDTQRKNMAGEDVYLPTSGVFAEALLGVSNAAEKLDATRHIHWHELPIPHQPTAIQPVSLGSRHADISGLDPTDVDSVLDVQVPTALPAPVTTAATLAALNNPNLFRDMSKTDQLVTVLGNLSQLAGNMATHAGTLAGESQKQAMASATELAGQVASLTTDLLNKGQQTATPGTQTAKGAAANLVETLSKQTAGRPSLSGTERMAMEALGVVTRATGPESSLVEAVAGGTSGYLEVPTVTDSLPEFLRGAPDAVQAAGEALNAHPGDKGLGGALLAGLVEQTVRPLLEEAINDPSAVDDALRALLHTQGTFALAGIDLPPSVQGQLYDLAGQGLRNAIDHANGTLGSGDTSALRRIEELLAVGTSADAFKVDMAAVLSQLNAKIDITDVTVEPPFAGTAPVLVRVKTRTTVGGSSVNEPGTLRLLSGSGSPELTTAPLAGDGTGQASISLRAGYPSLEVTVVAESSLSKLLLDNKRLDIPGELAASFTDYQQGWGDMVAELDLPAAVPPGATATLGLLITQGGHPISTTATLALNGEGSTGQPQVTTDQSGRAVVSYTAPSSGQGVAYLRAMVLVGEQHVHAMAPIQFG